MASTVIFFISRRFHPNYGLVSKPGTEFQCRAGWEWYVARRLCAITAPFVMQIRWECFQMNHFFKSCARFPSGAWQAIWTYGFGPFILYKIRKIQDTHRWRLQTTSAILFRSVFLLRRKKISKVFLPSMVAPSFYPWEKRLVLMSCFCIL